MRNYLQRGDALYVSAPTAGVLSGQGLLVGSIFGVASEDALPGVTFAMWLKGVYALPKTAAQAWNLGDPLYWDTTNLVVSNVASAGPKIGFAITAAANPSTVGQVLLVPTGSAGATKVVTGSSAASANGQHLTVTALDTIVTGLNQVVGVVATLNDDLTPGCSSVTASIGDQNANPVAGSFLLKTWQATANNNAAPVPATTFGKNVNWVAFGF